MKFLINPARRRRKVATRRKSGKRRMTAKQRAALRRMQAANKRKRRGAAPKTKRRKRRTTSGRSSKMARKRTSRRRTSRSRRRRSSGGAIRLTPVRGKVYRKNPSIRGILGRVVQGAKDAAYVTAGKAVSRIIADKLPAIASNADGSESTASKAIKQAGSALLAAMAARQFLGADAARLALAGGLSAPIEQFIKDAGVPYLSEALSDYPLLAAYPQGSSLAAYPMVGAGLAGMPQSGYPASEIPFFQQM